jgi:hypothetical protein
MASIPIPRQALGNVGSLSHDNPAAATAVLDGVTDFVAAYAHASKAGSIVGIAIWCTAKTGTPNVRAALEGYTDNNTPDNTVKGGGTPASVTTSTITAAAWNVFTFDNPYTVTVNELLVGVIRYVSGATSATFLRHVGVAYDHLPHSAFNAGSDTADHYIPSMAFIYSDGTYVFGCGGFTNNSATTGFNSGSTPDEIGVLFTMPHSAVCVGATVDAKGSTAAADFTVKLYDSNNNVLATASVDANAQAGVDNFSHIQVYWASVTLVAGQQYRLTILPDTATNVNLTTVTFASAALRENLGMFGGRTHRTNAGAWTDTDTTGHYISPLINTIETPAFGSGMSGGFDMFDFRTNGQTSNILQVRLLNSVTGAPMTGLTSASSGLIISTRADVEAAATAYTGSNLETVTTLGTFAAPTSGKARFREVDATNHKGLYEIQIADARFAVSNAKRLVISISGVTNLHPTDLIVVLDAPVDIRKVVGQVAPTPAVTGVLKADLVAVNGVAVSSATLDDVYTADIDVKLDANSDNYTFTWYKNGVVVTAGITAFTLTVVDRSAPPATYLLNAVSPTETEVAGTFAYDATGAGRMTAGQSVIIDIEATIDAGTRTWRRIIGRDTA